MRKINHSCILITVIMFLGFGIHAQKGHKEKIQGDKAYREETFSDAELSYRKSLDEDWSDNGAYNLGNSLFEQKRYDEAAKKYQELLNENTDPAIKADAWYNKGNAHFNQQDFGEALKSYIEALKLDPDDQDVKHNLLMAHKLLQQQQQQQQDQSQDENQDDNQEQNQQEQQRQEEQQENQEQQDSEQNAQNENEEEQNEEQESGTSLEEQKLSETEKQQLLQISEEEDKRVQARMKSGDNKLRKPEKDW